MGDRVPRMARAEDPSAAAAAGAAAARRRATAAGASETVAVEVETAMLEAVSKRTAAQTAQAAVRALAQAKAALARDAAYGDTAGGGANSAAVETSTTRDAATLADLTEAEAKADDRIRAARLKAAEAKDVARAVMAKFLAVRKKARGGGGEEEEMEEEEKDEVPAEEVGEIGEASSTRGLAGRAAAAAAATTADSVQSDDTAVAAAAADAADNANVDAAAGAGADAAAYGSSRPYFAAYVASHCTDDRGDFFKAMLQAADEAGMRDVTHGLGPCNHNRNWRPDVHGSYVNGSKSYPPAGINPRRLYAKYRWVVTMENVEEKGYVTEKLANGLASGAVPIYMGDEAAAYKMFNSDAFVSLRSLWRQTLNMTVPQKPSYADFLAAAREIVRIDREEPERWDAMRSVRDVINHHPERETRGFPARSLPNQPFPMGGVDGTYQRKLSPAVDEAARRLKEALEGGGNAAIPGMAAAGTMFPAISGGFVRGSVKEGDDDNDDVSDGSTSDYFA